MANILIIDDDEFLCETIATKLSRLGHRSDSVHTLQTALDKSTANNYDIIFLDVRMPDGNGLELLPSLKNFPSSPEVIIITGAGNPDGAELAIKSGAWCYLEKASIIREMVLPLTRALQYREEKTKAHPAIIKRKHLIGNSPQITKCLNQVAKAAESGINVLITGETGTGKEVFARVVHENSPRSGKNFVVVDCASLPEHLVESTLFGHEKGAFTDALKSNKGLIKQADGGTLFLDEIGELPLSLQKSFLRVLQEKSFRPVGAQHEVRSDFRLIAATNRDLDSMVHTGHFRSDLLFRVESFIIHLPPLHERPSDIEELTGYFINMLCKRYGHETKELSPEFIETLLTYDWPGNVRELFHVLDHVFTEAIHSPTLFPLHLPDKVRILQARMSVKGGSEEKKEPTPERPQPITLWREAKESFEKKYITNLLEHAHGKIQTASQLSGLSRTRLYQMLEKHNLLPAK